ncbi:hypothetical protein [Halostella sp. PRR32]|uniref:hypothetical protein n=1 Tax=Halostella sp. PRR32 TaxID=3098147 RepID=UPI002B1E6C43|nr:hypothetical protein [Halostella sp. PRR32]
MAKRVTKPLKKKLTPFLPILLIAGIVATVTTLLFMFTGYMSAVPTVRVPLLEWPISPRYFLFLSVFVVVVVVGGAYRFYRRNQEAILGRWEALSTWSQGTLIGFVSALFFAIGLAIASLFYTFPLYLIPVGFLVAWPLSAAVTLLKVRGGTKEESPSTLRSAFVRTGYAQMKSQESRTLAVLVGFLVAILGGLVIRYATVWYFGTYSLLAPILGGLLVWLLVAMIAYNRYESTTSERTDLVVVKVTAPESRAGRELTVRNEASHSIDLAKSKIRDTEYDLFRLGIDVMLGPGEVCTFEIPDQFSLAPNDDATDLPLGYTLKQGGQTPVIFTQSGEKFTLRRADDSGDHLPFATATEARPGVDPASQD